MRGALSLPTCWMRAETFSNRNIARSSSLNSKPCSSLQYVIKDLVFPNDSLFIKHIRIGFTGIFSGGVSTGMGPEFLLSLFLCL